MITVKKTITFKGGKGNAGTVNNGGRHGHRRRSRLHDNSFLQVRE
jgi:hypothetical protein